MKKSKNLLMMLFLFVCSLLLVGVMDVKAVVGFTNGDPVCSPNNNLKPGESTTCYIRGHGTQRQDDSKVHGFVTRLYTTDGLIFDSVEPYIDGTNAKAFEATSNSDKQYTVPLDDNKNFNFTCKYLPTLHAPHADYAFEDGDQYRCALFYSKGETATITVESAAPKGEDLIKLVGTGSGIMIVGKVLAHIDKNADANSSCGELCVFTKEIDSKDNYDMDGSEDYRCTEVHYTTNMPGNDTPTTGAFTSYALLAAGALVAISAVAIAKKHNKFYRV